MHNSHVGICTFWKGMLSRQEVQTDGKVITFVFFALFS